MRALVCLLCMLVPLAVTAETRVGVHAAGGIEGLLVKELHPAGVVEAGLAVEHLWAGKHWGLAGRFARIGRGYDDVAGEWKADAGLAFTNRAHTNRVMVGMGVRSMTIPGGEHRLPSTIRGVDLLRLDGQVQMARRGSISIDFFLGWTVGLYRGDRYEERIGDMIQATRSITRPTTAYVLGLQTTVTLD